ncbi:hypothetical protein [Terribacillus saccharophilus]|uniref:hypothetical protein n=1 Tax=Terribacillus saccharophilus TaxID=361277 RepID=UPI0039827D9F
MIENKKVSITTEVLVAIIAQSLSAKKVRDIGKEYMISRKEIDEIIKNPQTILENAKYEDQQLSLLEQIVIKSKQANKVGRFENLDKLMLVYPSKSSTVIVEWVQSKVHTFLQVRTSKLSEIIGNFYNLDTTLKVDPIKIILEMQDDQFEEIHHMDPALLDQIAEKGDFDPKIPLFLKDFKKNNQQASRTLFSKRKSNHSKWELETGMIIVPGGKYIWNIELDEEENSKYLIISMPVRLYVETAQQSFIEFLEKVETGPSKKDKNKSSKIKKEKFFSIKRGFSFFWKSNLFLLVALLFFFINKSSWVWDGEWAVEVFTILGELFILVCSFIACFRERE